MEKSNAQCLRELADLKRSYRNLIRANIYLVDTKKDLEEEVERLTKIIEEYEKRIEVKDDSVIKII